MSRKRSRADTSNLASPSPPRSVRRRALSDIDSDDSDVDDQQAAASPLVLPSMVALPPPLSGPLSETPRSSMVPSSGQQGLAHALHHPPDAVNSVVALPPPPPPPVQPPPVKPVKGKGRTKARADGLALTPEALKNELLQRNIIETQARLTLLENLVKEKDDSIGILNTRIQCFEKLENDAGFNQRFSSSTSTTPATPPSVLASTCSPCCPSSTLLSELRKVQQQIEDLSGAVSIVLNSVHHPTPPPSFQPGPPVLEPRAVKEASTQTCHSAPPQGDFNYRYECLPGVDVRFPPPSLTPRDICKSLDHLEHPAFFELEPEGLQVPLIPEQLIQQSHSRQPSALEQLAWPDIELGYATEPQPRETPPPRPPAYQQGPPTAHLPSPAALLPPQPGFLPEDDLLCMEAQLADIYPMPRYVKPKSAKKQKWSKKSKNRGKTRVSTPKVFSRIFWNSTTTTAPLIDLN